MNLTTFFAYVRKAPFGGRLSQSQIDGMNAILAEYDKRKIVDIRFLAYMLATTFHETAGRMQPVREALARSDAQAIDRLDKAYASGKLKVSGPYWRDGWFGRGLVQITHKANYDKFGITKADALDPAIAVRVLFDGMIKGMFTGKKLADYFNATVDDPVGARAIVNGKDKAKLIAGYHKNFLDALQAAQDPAKPDDVKASDAKPDDKPASQSTSAILTASVPAVSGLAVPLITGINNAYALIFALALLAVSGLAVFMFTTGRWTVNRSKAIP